MHGLRVALATLLSACTAATTVTTATTTTLPTTTTVVLSAEEAIAQFQLCLSAHGIEAEIPLGEDGRPDLTVLQGFLGVDQSAMRRALTDCASLLAAGGALDLSGEPVLGQAIRTQLTNFSVCMRSRGVEDFPDPDAEFVGTGLPYRIADLPVSDPEFASAIEACAAAVGVDPLRR